MEKIKAVWSKLLHQKATPNEIAFGFSLGFFVSFLPILGIQTLVGLLLAFLLRANKVTCLIGLHLHLLVFPLIPFVFFAEYLVGQALLPPQPGGELKFDEVEHLIHDHSQTWQVLKRCGLAMFLGSLVIGLPAAAASFWSVRRAASRWQASRQQKDADAPSPIP